MQGGSAERYAGTEFGESNLVEKHCIEVVCVRDQVQVWPDCLLIVHLAVVAVVAVVLAHCSFSSSIPRTKVLELALPCGLDFSPLYLGGAELDCLHTRR